MELTLTTMLIISGISTLLAVIGIMIVAKILDCIEDFRYRRAEKKRKDDEQDDRLAAIEQRR